MLIRLQCAPFSKLKSYKSGFFFKKKLEKITNTKYFIEQFFVDSSLLCIALPPHAAVDAAETSLVWVKIPQFNRGLRDENQSSSGRGFCGINFVFT